MLDEIFIDEAFDSSDLVGIHLGIDDPIYLDQVHYRLAEAGCVDESNATGEYTEVLNHMINEDEEVDIIDLLDEDSYIDDDETDVTAMDLYDLQSDDYEILHGIADDDIDSLDYLEEE